MQKGEISIIYYISEVQIKYLGGIIMKSLEQLKTEYREFRERQYEIYKALDENANEYSSDYKKSIYGIFEDDEDGWYRDFVMENLEAYSDEIDPDNFDEQEIYNISNP